MNQCRGAGLPEIMISLLLASLIMIALINHYLSAKQHYINLHKRLDDSMELQVVSELMRNSIRQAGFTPCLRLDRVSDLPVIDVTSGLLINRMSPYYETLIAGSSTTRLLITRNTNIHADRILIADCYHAEVQQVMNVIQTSEGQIVTLVKPLMFTYQPPVYVGEWIQERFFIGEKGGLFYRRDHAEELIPHVKNMSLTREANLVHITLDSLELDARIRAL